MKLTVVTGNINGQPCPWCIKVKNLLNMHDIEFEEFNPTPDRLRTLLADHGVKTIPQVFLGTGEHPFEKRIGGFEDTLAWINAGRPV